MNTTEMLSKTQAMMRYLGKTEEFVDGPQCWAIVEKSERRERMTLRLGAEGDAIHYTGYNYSQWYGSGHGVNGEIEFDLPKSTERYELALTRFHDQLANQCWKEARSRVVERLAQAELAQAIGFLPEK
jgi:hypothetical protein